MTIRSIGNARLYLALIMLSGLTACGGNSPTDSRAALLASCETSQGIGWLKREYGANYCDCWADQAKEVLSSENYQTLIQATQQEAKAADAADRDMIYRRYTHLYSTVSDAAARCAKAG